MCNKRLNLILRTAMGKSGTSGETARAAFQAVHKMGMRVGKGSSAVLPHVVGVVVIVLVVVAAAAEVVEVVLLEVEVEVEVVVVVIGVAVVIAIVMHMPYT